MNCESKFKSKSNKKSGVCESWVTDFYWFNFDLESKANQIESRIKMNRFGLYALAAIAYKLKCFVLKVRIKMIRIWNKFS